MEFELTEHARWRMRLRGISLEEVKSVLEDPGQVVANSGGAIEIYQSVFVGRDGKPYLLRVFVNRRSVPPRVITVYRTSKVDKYRGR